MIRSPGPSGGSGSPWRGRLERIVPDMELTPPCPGAGRYSGAAPFVCTHSVSARRPPPATLSRVGRRTLEYTERESGGDRAARSADSPWLAGRALLLEEGGP